jgi:hypothetical protein
MTAVKAHLYVTNADAVLHSRVEEITICTILVSVRERVDKLLNSTTDIGFLEELFM